MSTLAENKAKLIDLYNSLETIKSATDEGFFSKEQEEKIRKVEEDIVKSNILPIIKDQIEPILDGIKGELVIVVDYKQKQPLNVYLSRKRNISDVTELLGAKIMEMDAPVDHRNLDGDRKPKKNIAPSKIIRVHFPDGKTIEAKNAAMTLVETIRHIGVERVRQLCTQRDENVFRPNGVLLVSNMLDSKYKTAQKPIESAGITWYVMTCTNADAKQRQIEAISSALNLGLRVEVIDGSTEK